MGLLFQKIKEYFLEGEAFLVVTIACGRIQVVSARVDFDKKIVTLKKAVSGFYKQDDPLDAMQILTSLVKPLGNLMPYKVIVSLGSNMGTTLYSTVTLTRDTPKIPIDASDLDNRIAQGMWKVFDRERGNAAKKMGVEDLEVLLTDVRIKNIRLDGHKVVNPVGFPASTIELQFNQTFLPQRFAAALRELFRDARLVLMAEGGVMQADMLTRLDFPPFFLFAEIFPHTANLFSVNEHHINYLETLPWGKEHIPHALATDFAVEKKVAEELLNIQSIRRASQPVLKRIEKSILQAFQIFVAHCDAVREDGSPKTILLSGTLGIPELVFSITFRVPKGRIRALRITPDIFEKKLGFSIVYPSNMNQDTVFSGASALLEFYFLKRDDKINSIAKRHARWLIN